MTSKIIWGDSPLVMSEIPYTTFLGQAHVMTISPGERAEWVRKFFRTLTSEICHLQLGTPFHKRPAVLELGSLEKVASRSHHLQFHHSLPAASLVPTWRCSMIKTRNFARAQFISSSPKLVRIFVHVGYFILNICCCSMSVALLALSFDLFLIVAFIACIRSKSTTWDKNRNRTNKPIIFNNLVIVI